MRQIRPSPGPNSSQAEVASVQNLKQIAHRNSGIQSLRAIAVLSVIAFHLDPSWLPGGFLGVDIFFVISGFVITQSLQRDYARGTRSILLYFYLKRFLRIAPALFVCLGISAVLVALFVPHGFYPLGGGQGWTAIAATFGLANISLYLDGAGYFSERLAFNAYSHTWSLGVEEQFYLLFPLLLCIVFLGPLIGRVRAHRLAFLTLATLTLLSFLWSAWQTSEDFAGAFYLLPSRFWQIGVGALCAILALRSGRPGLAAERNIWAMALAGACLVGASLLLADPQASPFPWGVPAVLGTVLLILAFQPEEEKLPCALRTAGANRVLNAVGDWSYSLYLWHWPVIVLLRWTVGVDMWWHLLVAFLLTFFLGFASYTWVERPILDRRLHRVLQPRALIALGAICTVSVAGALYLGDRGTGKFLTLTTTSNTTPDSLVKPPAKAGDPADVFAGIEGIGRNKTVFVIGDSHAGHFFYLLENLGETIGFDYRVIDDRDCRLVSLVSYRGTCTEHTKIINEVLDEAEAGDVVLLSSLRTPRVSNLVSGQNQPIEVIVDSFLEAQAQLDDEKIINEAVQVIGEFSQAGLTVVLPTPSPVVPSPVFRCSDWFNSMNSACAGGLNINRQEMLAMAEPANRRIELLADKHGTVTWNVFDVLCPEASCSASFQGRYIYYDGDHLSAWGNHVLMESFAQVLEAEWTGSARR